MSDLLLTELLSSLARTEEGLREGLSTEDTGVLFPPITVILSGAVVSGRVATYRTYRMRLRAAIAEFEGGGERGIEVVRVFFGEVYEALDRVLDHAESETVSVQQLYLVDVHVLTKNRVVHTPPMSISLEAVQGWTLGRMPTS